jgi:hypothetical protein
MINFILSLNHKNTIIFIKSADREHPIKKIHSLLAW